MHEAYLSLGANLGDRKAALRGAIDELGKLEDTEVSAVSALYETSPVGFSSDKLFLNCAVKLRTGLPPPMLLEQCQRIERKFGRERDETGERPRDRTLDIDIILYGQLTLLTPDLVIPHPETANRLFVLVPLAEIEEGLIINGRAVGEWIELARAEHPEQEVRRYPDG
jgi:2-amino-4-hydroxy-6-hydroxymethyldihydropteridine diphosphokinase